jgi:hypothetical protein
MTIRRESKLSSGIITEVAGYSPINRTAQRTFLSIGWCGCSQQTLVHAAKSRLDALIDFGARSSVLAQSGESFRLTAVHGVPRCIVGYFVYNRSAWGQQLIDKFDQLFANPQQLQAKLQAILPTVPGTIAVRQSSMLSRGYTRNPQSSNAWRASCSRNCGAAMSINALARSFRLLARKLATPYSVTI